jgi:tetratricopeptide (TPR) repeat protein
VSVDLTARAVALIEAGDLEGAQALFQYALDVNVATFGADCPALADDLSNLGNVLADQRDFDAARPLLERAVALRATLQVADDIFRRQLGLPMRPHGWPLVRRCATSHDPVGRDVMSLIHWAKSAC